MSKVVCKVSCCFLLGDAPWLGRPVEVDSNQISQHTQNVQINKVIGEDEKCAFYFLKEKNHGLLGQRNNLVTC